MCVNNLPSVALDNGGRDLNSRVATYWSRVQHTRHSATEPHCGRL